MSTLEHISDEQQRPAREMGWMLSLVHHPELAWVGRRLPLVVGGVVRLGRGDTCFGDGALEDARLSRQHAEVGLDAQGRPHVVDLDSRNGTYVNGARVKESTLTAGDIIGVGALLFLVHRTPAHWQPRRHPSLVGTGHGLSRVLEDIEKVAPERTTVLVLGETGTGKEPVARELHRASGRKGRFCAVNCGNMPDALLQSELFGHVRGAFSGAEREREGMAEAAHGGTLFLDEIGDAPPALQVGLLRFLQEGEVRRLGANKTVKVDVRVVAATHRHLPGMIARGTFREDLYARLARWVIQLPPLRERLEDIPHLAASFIQARQGEARPLHHRLMLRLLSHHWPRNVRELETVIERALIESRGETPIPLTPAVEALLSGEEVRQGTEEATPEAPPASEGGRTRRKPEPEELRTLLLQHQGNITTLAQVLGVGRNTLYRWFKAAGIDPNEVRAED